MSLPNSESSDGIRELLIAAMSPGLHRVSASELRRSGLHREMFRTFYEAFRPEIGNLRASWKALREFEYSTRSWSFATSKDVQHGVQLTSKWLAELENLGLSDELAILLFDGETMRPPAPDYRIFLLKDGDLVYYEGGFHAGRSLPLVAGGALTVLDALDQRHRQTGSLILEREPFFILMKAFIRALESAVGRHKQEVAAREALLGQLQATADMLTAK